MPEFYIVPESQYDKTNESCPACNKTHAKVDFLTAVFESGGTSRFGQAHVFLCTFCFSYFMLLADYKLKTDSVIQLTYDTERVSV